MDNRQLAQGLEEMAALLELLNRDLDRAQLYRRAAVRLRELETPIAEVLSRAPAVIPGLERSVLEEIVHWVRSGRIDRLEELRDAVPAGVQELLRLKGLGPKRAGVLWRRLGIDSLEELERACLEGRIRELEGFGPALEGQLLEALRQYRRYRGLRRLSEALAEVEPILRRIRALPGVARAELAGELRRHCPVVSGYDLLVVTSRPEGIRQRLPEFGWEEGEPDQLQGRTPGGMPIRCWITDFRRFGTRWILATGSEAHLQALRSRGPLPEAITEEAVYAALGLTFIPPPMREGRGEIERAARGRLGRLVQVRDLRGLLHVHTTYSDGIVPLRQMAIACRDLGYAYLGICDHSQSARYARGLDPERLLRQQAEIEELNAELAPFRIYKGIESDILPDGSLDYPEEILRRFDFVVASIHSGFRMTEQEATRRLIRAVENPHTCILGHLTGRLLLEREGYPVNVPEVLQACAAHGVAIELNANPYRLDLDWTYLPLAVELGVPVAIDPDAHDLEGLEDVRYGVMVAQKAGLGPEHVLNTRTPALFERWLRERRQRKT